MRVLFVTNAREIGGAEIYLQGLTRALWRRGIYLRVVCPPGPLARSLAHDPIPVVPLDLGTPAGRYRGLNLLHPGNLAHLRSVRRLLQQLQTEAPLDLVHVQQDFKEKLLVSLAARQQGIPVIWTEHGQLLPWLTRPPCRYLYQWAANHLASRIIAVSETVRRSLLQINIRPDLIRCVRNGIPANEFQPQPPDPKRRAMLGIAPDRLVLTTACRLRRSKGLQYALQSLADLRASGFDRLVYLILGEGKHRLALEAQAARLGLTSSVIFAGFQPCVAPYLAQSDLFVYPSVDREGLPLGVLEAMAMGLPVVATAAGDTAEAVQDGVTGYLVPPGDQRALTAALQKLVADPVRRAAFGAAGRDRYLQRFTLDRMVAETLAVFAEAAGPTAPKESLRA